MTSERVARLAVAILFGMVLSILFGMILSISFELVVGTAAANAAAPSPHISESAYIISPSTSVAYNLGCNNGSVDTRYGFTTRLDILARLRRPTCERVRY